MCLVVVGFARQKGQEAIRIGENVVDVQKMQELYPGKNLVDSGIPMEIQSDMEVFIIEGGDRASVASTINASVDYYEECKTNLGSEFAYKVQKTIQRILTFPTAWQNLDGEIRRCLINRFPFGVIYYQRNNEIIILAIMQLQRKPNYWKERKI